MYGTDGILGDIIGGALKPPAPIDPKAYQQGNAPDWGLIVVGSLVVVVIAYVVLKIFK